MEKLSKILFIIVTYIIVYNGFFVSSIAYADSNVLLIQSTTSTRDSGLYKYILPKFEDEYDIKAYVVAVGTGQALQNAKNCDGDILIVHSRKLEDKFINEGFGIQRENLMYNDYVVIGPSESNLKIDKNHSVTDFFKIIMNNKFLFVSRGDNSGTNLAELDIWNNLSISSEMLDKEWYLKTGQGMGQTLNIAIGLNAYTFTDRATWTRFKNKKDHIILYENDPLLVNQYGIIKINPKHCSNINHNAAKTFFDWILSKKGQKLISEYMVDEQYLFSPGSISDL